MSKSGYGFVKSKTFSFQLPNQSSHPIFHPSTKTPLMLLAAAKSIYRLTLAVFPPCFPFGISCPSFERLNASSAYFQPLLSVCISHHTPANFIGFIHVESFITEGSFRFKIILEERMPAALSLMMIVRQGVTAGACR